MGIAAHAMESMRIVNLQLQLLNNTRDQKVGGGGGLAFSPPIKVMCSYASCIQANYSHFFATAHPVEALVSRFAQQNAVLGRSVAAHICL